MTRGDSTIGYLEGRRLDGTSETEGGMNSQMTCALLALMHDHLSWTRQEDEEPEPALAAGLT